MGKSSKEKVEEMKKAAKEVAVEVMEETKKVLDKVGEKAEPVIKEAEKMTGDVIEEVKKQTAPVTKKAKEETKKVAKKVQDKMMEKEVYFQYADTEIHVKTIMKKVEETYVSMGHRASSMKSLKLYIKPEENAVYYVINEKIKGKIELN